MLLQNNFEIEAETTPLPRPDITPPVTKINFVCIYVEIVSHLCSFSYKRVLLFSFFVYSVILFCSFDEGVFSIIYRLALPTITASTPTETYLFTSLGVDTPNPIPMGSL